MFRLAWRNLTSDRLRLGISAGGVALAVLLTLVMSGVFAGSEQHAVTYIEHQPASLWVIQAGVENIHMATSILPADVIERVRQVPGVGEAVGVLYTSLGVDVGSALVPSYLFGVEPGASFGGPWSLVAGRAEPGSGEIVLDRALARRYGLELGDTVGVAGRTLTIAGFSKGTFGIATSITFVNKSTLAALMGVSPQASSYILIRPDPKTDVQALAGRLKTSVPEANIVSRTDFVKSERALIRQMGTDVIRAMSTVAYVIALLVIGLTIYTATLERAREYGVLKAIGANHPQLVSVVFAQAFVAAGLGYLIGIALAWGTAALVGRLFPEVLILIRPALVMRTIPTLALVTALSALLPLGRIMRLDPLVAFRG